MLTGKGKLPCSLLKAYFHDHWKRIMFLLMGQGQFPFSLVTEFSMPKGIQTEHSRISKQHTFLHYLL